MSSLEDPSRPHIGAMGSRNLAVDKCNIRHIIALPVSERIVYAVVLYSFGAVIIPVKRSRARRAIWSSYSCEGGQTCEDGSINGLTI